MRTHARLVLLPVLAGLLVAPGPLTAQKPARPTPVLLPRSGAQGSAATPIPPSGSALADNPDFSRVDALADAAPASVTQSVAGLAAYLAQAGPDDLSRARAIYRWVTGNIAYDVAGFRSGNYGDLSPDGVLRRRTGVCSGYASIAEALGAAMGLEITTVNGWSKGYGFTAGQRFEGRTNHAWNAVRIDGQWRLMDPTWGAGYLNQQMQFVRRFQPHYFLTAPESFIFDHLPEDPQWQLLDRPITADEYADLAYLRPAFFVSGFRIGSHPGARIAADGPLTVTLGVTRPVEMSAVLLDAATEQRLSRDLTFVQVDAREARIATAFPAAGDYLLRLFARPLGAEGSLAWVLDYRVQASRGAPDAGFPTAFSSYGVRGVTLLEPMAGTLAAGRSHRFRLIVPGALQVAVVANGQWTHFTRAGEEWAADVPAVPGTITVYAKYDEAADFQGLLRFTGR